MQLRSLILRAPPLIRAGVNRRLVAGAVHLRLDNERLPTPPLCNGAAWGCEACTFGGGCAWLLVGEEAGCGRGGAHWPHDMAGRLSGQA